MTPLPDGSLAELPKCVICGKQLDDISQLYCATRRCQHEYERRYSMAHNSKEYREYIFWYQYTVHQIQRDEWGHDVIESLD